MECLDWIEPDAKEIGAVNTVVVENDRLLGYNTDAAGLIDPLLEGHGFVGAYTGGDNRRGWCCTCGSLGAAAPGRKRHALRARRRKANPLAQLFNVSCQPLSGASFAGYDLVINATPLGSGEYIDQSPATQEQLRGARCVYDLIYNPMETLLLREARSAGCETLGGLEMLVAQAQIQFELWTGKRASATLMYESAGRVLGDAVTYCN